MFLGFLTVCETPDFLKSGVFMAAEGILEPRPVAVPYIFSGGQRRLENIDRCHSLRSLYLPPAALPSLPSGNPEVDPKLATQAG